MTQQYRVAISDFDNRCHCDGGVNLEDGVQYCKRCQYIYSSQTDYRCDYADTTVAWCSTEEEADAVEANIVGGWPKCEDD